MKKTLTILIASSMLFAVGCKKEEMITDTVQAVKEAVQGNWDKSAVNGLLEYIPADSAMVYASTRAIDFNSPAMQSYFKKSEKMLREQKVNGLHGVDIDQAAFDKMYDASIELMANFEKTAPEWGLDPQGKADLALYMTATKAVVKFSLADGEKFKVKAGEILKSFSNAAVSELNVGTEKWMLVKNANDDSVGLVLNFGAKVLTASVVFDMTEDMTYLNDLLKPVTNPMGKDALGKLSDETAGIGFIDTVKVLSLILDPKTDLGKVLTANNTTPVSELCSGEMKSIAEAFPRIDFDAIIGAADIRMNAILKIKNGDTILDLKSMLGKRIAIETAKSVANLFVSLDFHKSIEILSKWGSAVSQKPYSCEDLSFINETGTSLSGLPVITGSGQFKFVHSISGFGLSLESLEIVEDMPKFSASAYVIGSDIVDAAKFAKAMLGKEVKQLKALKIEKNVVSSIDLSDLVHMPLILKTQFSDNGIIMATGEGVDIAQLSKIDVKAGQDILNFKIDYKLFGLLEKSLKMDYIVDVSVSVCDEGIKATSVTSL